MDEQRFVWCSVRLSLFTVVIKRLQATIMCIKIIRCPVVSDWAKQIRVVYANPILSFSSHQLSDFKRWLLPRFSVHTLTMARLFRSLCWCGRLRPSTCGRNHQNYDCISQLKFRSSAEAEEHARVVIRRITREVCILPYTGLFLAVRCFVQTLSSLFIYLITELCLRR